MFIRHSRIVARDTLAVDGCTSAPDRHGSDGLTVIARILAIEDTEIVAGSASFLRFSQCTGQQQSPLGGDAGAAVRAETDATVLVRTFVSDGNGGDVQNGNWAIAPQPGVVRRSSFVSAGSIFQAYDSVQEAGRVGRLAAAENLVRTAAAQISLPDAPFTVGGDGRLGGTVLLSMNNLSGRQAIGFLCFAFQLSNPNAQGHTWFDPRRVVLTTLFTGNDSRSFTVPNDPHLVGVVVVGQVFDLTLGRMVNPSGIVLRP
jgi:hypothetical protein